MLKELFSDEKMTISEVDIDKLHKNINVTVEQENE